MKIANLCVIRKHEMHAKISCFTALLLLLLF